MPWTPAHTLLLFLCPLGLFWYWYTGRSAGDRSDPYSVGMNRFRIAVLISSISGLVGLLKFWLKIRK